MLEPCEHAPYGDHMGFRWATGLLSFVWANLLGPKWA